MVAMTEKHRQKSRAPWQEASGQTLDFALHDERDVRRQECEAYVAARYDSSYGARLRGFLPQLLSMSRAGELQACVGLRPGSETPLFLEQYLDMPVEQAIAALCRRPVNRHAIAEIGNLVATRRGSSLMLFLLMARSLELAGFQWLAFTATPQVEKLVKRLGVEPCFMARAQGERLGHGLGDWGSYYQSQPNVMALQLPEAMDAVRAQPGLVRMLEQHQLSSERLGQQLRPVRWPAATV